MPALTALFVGRVRKPGKYYDKYGLYLLVTPSGHRYWEQRYTPPNAQRRIAPDSRRNQYKDFRRTVGIGPATTVSLAAAREQALENLRLVAQGQDPVELRKQKPVPTLKAAVCEVIELHRVRWTNARQATIWHRAFENHVYPHLGDKLVSDITSDDLLAVLTPIWNSRTDTARRLRQRLSTIMKWAIVQRFRTDNPAEVALAALPKVAAGSDHYQALPHAEVSAALALVRASDALSTTRLAFEFLVLSATRSGEVRGARWEEVDFDKAIWIIPAGRMKSRKAHHVPLSGPALALLRKARETSSAAGLVFPSPRDKPLSDSTISALVRTLKIKAVPHGFRSSFRDWCAETGVDREVAEACLAHVVVNKVEAAYRRTDLLERRRPVMEDWANYVTAGLAPCAFADGKSGSRS